MGVAPGLIVSLKSWPAIPGWIRWAVVQQPLMESGPALFYVGDRKGYLGWCRGPGSLRGEEHMSIVLAFLMGITMI